MNKPTISIIAAIDQKRGIGKDNKLPWDIPEDMQRFRDKTKGHAIVMGRKTFESIGRPLPNRVNIVVTRDKDYKAEGCTICPSLEEALIKAKEIDKDEIFVIGGGEIYRQALPFSDKLYLTLVEGDYGADTFFPEYAEFKKIVLEKKEESGNYKYTFLDLEK
jgi:dihydrofolate reductase